MVTVRYNILVCVPCVSSCLPMPVARRPIPIVTHSLFPSVSPSRCCVSACACVSVAPGWSSHPRPGSDSFKDLSDGTLSQHHGDHMM